MKKNAFLEEKSAKKKSAKNAVWVLLFFCALIVALMVKIFFTGSLNSGFDSGGLPTNEDAYEVAQEYVRPTIRGSADFADEGFQFAKLADSVYVIKSTLESEGKTTEFKITLRYKGGQHKKQSNWSVIDLSTY